MHLRLLKKGRWEWKGFVVCAFHSTAWSMGWLGSNVATWRHLVGHHVKVPTLVQHVVVVAVVVVVVIFFDVVVVIVFDVVMVIVFDVVVVVMIVVVVDTVGWLGNFVVVMFLRRCGCFDGAFGVVLIWESWSYFFMALLGGRGCDSFFGGCVGCSGNFTKQCEQSK